MDMELIITVIIAIVGSNALWGFIQFLVQRKDNKDEYGKKIMDMITKLNENFDKKFTELDNRSTERNNKLTGKIDKLENELNERAAISCRVRIIKFMDEILQGWSHSHDSYVQVMQDITNYLRYCAEHPEFKNHQTETTIAYIKADYQERLEKNDFSTNN